jgi:predicted DNA-binding WGR domain protein
MTMLDDDDLPVVPDEVAPPLWFRYCIMRGGGHDKFYEVRVDLDESGQWVLTKRWGRRPDHLTNGQRQVKVYRNMEVAIRDANEVYQSKIGKGYWPTERGF